MASPPPVPGSPPLLDPRHGPIVDLETLATPAVAPAGLSLVEATLADGGPVGLPLGGRRTAGTSFEGPGTAAQAAIGEAVERWVGAHPVPVAATAAAVELADADQPHLPPDRLALHHPAQLATPGFPFRGLRGDEETAWTYGHHPTVGPVLVPVSVVRLDPDPRHHHYPSNAGIAAHRRWAPAVRAAVAETVERDAVATAWEQPHVPLPRLPRPTSLADVDGLTLHLVPQPRQIPVVLAALRDRRRQRLTVGTAAAADWTRAATKATAEAALLHRAAAALDDPGSALWELLADTRILLDHRPDRRYRDACGPQLREIVDPLLHLQLALDPDVQTGIERRLEAPPVAAVPTDGEQALQRSCDEAIVVDRTTPAARDAGWCVVRTILPGHRATAPWPFAFLGGPDPIDPAVRCRVPLPHA